MYIDNNVITPEEGKVLYNKLNGNGPFYAVALGFIKDANGNIVPDSDDNYEEREKNTPQS